MPGSCRQCTAAPFQPFLLDTGLCFAIQAEHVSPCICKHKNATATSTAALRREFISAQMHQQESPKKKVPLEIPALPLSNQLFFSLTFCTVITASWVLLSVVTLNISTPSSSFI